jgi:ABC-type oligopeptide transport system substrate-binding subunit
MNDELRTGNDRRGTKGRPLWRLAGVLILILAATCLLSQIAAGQQDKKDQRVLLVAVRHLPEFVAPGTAWTSAEKQILPLLFESLAEPTGATLGARYRPGLAAELPVGDGLQARLRLRPGAKWSDGSPVSAADVRHTYALLAGRAPAWKDLFELPRLQSPSEITWTSRQGLFDPWFALTEYIVPQQYRGKPLNDPRDAEFGKAPIGSGPFHYVGREKLDGRDTAVLRRNPHAGAPKGTNVITEIRFVSWSDAGKDLPALNAHVVLDGGAADMKPLRGQRYAVRTALPARVHYLAVNHRRAGLNQAVLRRALALALDRGALLKSLDGGDGDAAAVAVNSLFPAQSWAVAPPPRVSASLHQPELARSLAKEFAKDLDKSGAAVNLALSLGSDDPRHAAACTAIAAQLKSVLEDAGVTISVKPAALAPHVHRAALDKHDFDLALCSIDDASAILPLMLLFDPHPDALKPGGANFTGYANDAKLQSLLASIHAHRQFTVRRDLVHDLHAHLVDVMPVIPLWQAPVHVAVRADVTAPDFDPRRVFADIERWTLK